MYLWRYLVERSMTSAMNAFLWVKGAETSMRRTSAGDNIDVKINRHSLADKQFVG
jgi:hypothetical protein